MSIYLDLSNAVLKQFKKNKKLNRCSYPLNLLPVNEDNDILIDKGIDKSIEKEIRSLFFVTYRMLKLNNRYKKNIYCYKSCVKNDLEYFFFRYRIIIDIIDKHLLKGIGFKKKDVPLIIYDLDEFKQLRDARNMITHEGLRTQIFVSNDQKKVSFQMYKPGSLDNMIVLPNYFKDTSGTEIYYLDHYIAWLMILLLRFLEMYFLEIANKRLEGKEADKVFIENLKYYNTNNELDCIQFWMNDFFFMKKLIENFIVHVNKYEADRKIVKKNLTTAST
jgi:hypothetical protein